MPVPVLFTYIPNIIYFVFNNLPFENILDVSELISAYLIINSFWNMPLRYTLYGYFFLWLVVFYVQSTARSFGDGTPHLLSLVKDVKLGFYTVPTCNRTPDRRVAVHHTTAAPRQFHCVCLLNQSCSDQSSGSTGWEPQLILLYSIM